MELQIPSRQYKANISSIVYRQIMEKLRTEPSKIKLNHYSKQLKKISAFRKTQNIL